MILHPTQRCSPRVCCWCSAVEGLLSQITLLVAILTFVDGPLASLDWESSSCGSPWYHREMQQAPRAAVKSFPARCAKSMPSWTNDQKQSGSPWLPLYDRGRRRPSDKLRDFLHRDRRFGISQGPQDYQSGDTTLGDHHGNRCCYWLSQVSAAVWAEGYEASAPTWDDDCGNANGQSRCYSSRSSSTSTE